MKKILVVLFLAAAAAFAANAQDVITKVDGTVINAKVLEVNPGTIKYSRLDNPGGPVYVIYISDIHTIKYENGLLETYNDLAGEARPEVTAPADNIPMPREATEEEIAAAEAAEAAEAEEPQPDGHDQPWWEYEPGRTPVSEVRYRDIAGYYDTKDYVERAGDPYVPAVSGIASFLIPGFGQFIDGEWGRGLGIMATNIGFGVLEWAEVCALFYTAEESTRLYRSYYTDHDSYMYSRYRAANGMVAAALGAGLLTVAAQTAFNIWNICDAVKIAKVKNMYYNDTRARNYASLDMNLSPQIAFAPTAAGNLQPTAGLSLKVSF